MPKAEKGSLKDIGKRIKAKGLQKLKFYCQMCMKQCRDANGFKCHLTSDAHLYQMKIFASNATSYMDQYSKEFEKVYMDTLRMRHSTSKVLANTVYQEVIQDRKHIHMNSTIWASLSDFCKYLGKTGQCIVEETERGWYITYIERSVTKLLQAEMTQKRIEAEQAAEIASNQRMEQQRIAAAIAYDRATLNQTTDGISSKMNDGPTKLLRNNSTTDDSTPIQLSLSVINHKKLNGKKRKASTALGTSVFDDNDSDGDSNDDNNIEDIVVTERTVTERPNGSYNHSNTAVSKERSNSGQHMKQHATSTQQAKKQNTSTGTSNNNNDDVPWLYNNMMVRIINQSLENGKYFRCKGVVMKVIDKYIGQIRIISNYNPTTDDTDVINDIIQFDQDDCETVIPKQITNEPNIILVRGIYRGRYGIIQTIHKKQSCADIVVTLPKHYIDTNSTTTTTTTSIITKQYIQEHTSKDDYKEIVLRNVSFDDFSMIYEG